MKYKVILEESEEGFAASVPGLPESRPAPRFGNQPRRRFVSV